MRLALVGIVLVVPLLGARPARAHDSMAELIIGGVALGTTTSSSRR